MSTDESAQQQAMPEPAPPIDGGALLSAIRAMVDEVRDDLTGQLSALDARVTAAEQRGPQFRPAETRTFGRDEVAARYEPNDPNDILGMIPSDGQVRSGEKRRVRLGSNGLMTDAPDPVFGPSARVLLNLDARPNGNDRTWGELRPMAHRPAAAMSATGPPDSGLASSGAASRMALSTTRVNSCNRQITSRHVRPGISDVTTTTAANCS